MSEAHEARDPASAVDAVDAVDRVVARIRATYGRWNRQTPIAQMRADWDALFPADVPAAVHAVDADGVPCEWVAAPGARPDRAIAYLHGGGFQLGSPRSHRELMAALSAASGACVLGIGYRMTPEHRWPVPLDDGCTAMRWLQAQGLAGDRVAVAGDSAGGGLALALLLSLPAQGLPRPAAGLTLSAWTDMGARGESYDTRAAQDPLHQRPMMRALARNYLGEAGDPDDPRASPLCAAPAALRTLPPLLLQVGDRETLLSDSVDFARRVREAGGQAECQVWPGMVHVFQQFPAELPEASRALREAGAFLAGHLGCTPVTQRTPA